MAKKSNFRDVIQYDGHIWHLVYDPNSDITVPPNLGGAQVGPLIINEVRFPNDPKPAWLVTMGVLFPPTTDMTGRVVNERRMLGFRTFDYEPPKQLQLPYTELAYYLAEPSVGDDSMAQRFLEAVIGINQPSTQQLTQAEKDTSWTERFAKAEEAVQKAEEAPSVMPAEGVEP